MPMHQFLDSLKKNKYQYIIAISLVATAVIINNAVDFADKIIKKPLLMLISIAVLIFFISISMKEEIWKNGK